MNAAQRNFCRNQKTLRRRFALNEWQMARYLMLPDEAAEALARGEWSPEVDQGTLILIHAYYGITPAQMLGDEEKCAIQHSAYSSISCYRGGFVLPFRPRFLRAGRMYCGTAMAVPYR